MRHLLTRAHFPVAQEGPDLARAVTLNTAASKMLPDLGCELLIGESRLFGSERQPFPSGEKVGFDSRNRVSAGTRPDGQSFVS
jgi:hypothetical protein